MNEFINSIGAHHVEIVYFLLFLLFVFVCLLFLASVKHPADAHASQKRQSRGVIRSLQDKNSKGRR